MSLINDEDDDVFADFDPDEFIARHRGSGLHVQPQRQSEQSRKREWAVHLPSNAERKESQHEVHHLKKAAHVKSESQESSALTDAQSQALHKTLFQYFGHSSFRQGQLDIISSLIFEQKDAAFFCPTGKGKSLCYQLPPLFLDKVCIVVSPLISLMQDQVTKLNSIAMSTTHARRKMAVFLGSGQTDVHAERDALQGLYSLVYCTPEKLVAGNSNYFLHALVNLHLRNNNSKEICLFAIDESHCVSDWGHDFRPQYRQIGHTLRSHPVLQNIPILALTATAVPRVQRDILSSLHFRQNQSHIVTQSIDRPNLILHIHRKPQGGFKAALASFSDELVSMTDQKSELAFGSTIIYAPTQTLVEEIFHWLKLFTKSECHVLPYHAGLSLNDRSLAHMNFLIGTTKVIVATIAFGMGIDKPDIRRIIHYGPPTTIEDYYQQIGRCGRDGLESSCFLYCNEGDFVAYKSSFYTGSLKSEIRTFRDESIDSFRNFCMNDEACRRANLLEYFGQQVTFENGRCGTCDTCRARIQYSSDLERDFADGGARLVLYAISVLKENTSLSWIEHILSEKIAESHRYRSVSINPQRVQDTINTMKSTCSKGKRWPVSYFTKGFLPSLVNAGYVYKCDVSSQIYGMKYTSTWVGYDLTLKGRVALTSGPIVLPVPTFIREIEERHDVKNRSRLAQLESAGVDITQIPRYELEAGDGEVMRSLETWHRYLDNLEKRGKSAFVNDLGDLRFRLYSWRSDMASQYLISPSVALPEHLLLNIAYLAGTLPPQMKVHQDALVAAGLRFGNLDKLLEVIDEWRSHSFLVSENMHATVDDKTPIPLPDGPFQPSQPWKWSEYKPKKSGLPAWEVSYNRFIDGEHPQTIAMTQVSGRPIQVATVVSHILTALTHGKSVPLKRLADVHELPTIHEWNRLTFCEEETHINVCDDPKTCGVNGTAFSIKDFLLPIMGPSFAGKEFTERTIEEQEKFSKWCNTLNWYLALRRVGYTCKK